jgi:hypothetical protein
MLLGLWGRCLSASETKPAVIQGVGVDLCVHPRADTEVRPYNSTREETWSLHNRRNPLVNGGGNSNRKPGF